MAEEPFKNLQARLGTPDSFPDRFLSQSCPLLKAGGEAQRSGLQKPLTELLNGDLWQRFVTECGEDWRKGTDAKQHQPAVVLQARRDLVLAAMGHDVPDNLRRAIGGYQRAIGHEFVPQLQDVCQSADRFRSTAIHRRLNAAGNSTHDLFTQLATEFGGWNPALLATAAGYADVFASAPNPDHQVKTHLLFALGKQDGGLIARLTLKRFDFDADAGGGACYPDPVSMGYIKSHACFQQALQQAWWREILPHLATCTFDICWSLQLIEDHGRPNDDSSGNADANLRSLRTDLMLPLSGPSAGMAFACAFRALRLKEQLDPHMAITADFAAHFDSNNTKSRPVGSVLDKLRAKLEQAGIDEVLTSNKDEYFANNGIQPDENGVCISPAPQRGKLKLIGLPDLDAFYKRASRHARLTQLVKQHLRDRAKLLLKTTCTPYVRSSLSNRRPGEPAKQEPPEVPMPLSDQQVEAILHGRLEGSRRVRLLAESGLGKSTLLIEAEYLIAAADDARIPLRLGAGPASCSKDDLGRWTRLPLLSDFDWQQKTSDLLDDLAELLLGDVLPDTQERTDWFQRAVQEGGVFLLDSLDQTDKALKFDKFAKSDGVRQCALLLSARPETRRTNSQGYAGIDWQTLWVDPFDKDRIRKFWGDAPLLDRLLAEEDWAPLREVPVLLQQMKRLANAGRLENLPNREAVYHRTLAMLVQHGHGSLEDAGQHEVAKDDLLTVETLMAEIAWETIQLEAVQTNGNGASFTGEFSGHAYAGFAKSHKQLLDTLDQLNLTTRQTYLDEFGVRHDQFAWRHFSFCEWFAGLHLASLSSKEQEACVNEHALDERWSWIFRFALAAAARQRNREAVEHLTTCLLAAGAPFLLWKCINSDHISVDGELETLCRWLVHRDRASWEELWDSATSPWTGKGDSDRPAVDERTASLLKSMFAIDDAEPWRRRDSRWLHPAWQLVIENLTNEVASETKAQTVCREIHNAFLSEFETRVREAAGRNQHCFRKDWRYEDQGLLQLVPDDVLLQLGVLPTTVNDTPTMELLRNWPESIVDTYRQRRDRFNSQLNKLGANYCQCPPIGWEHPYPADDGTTRDPRECHVRGTELRRQADGSWTNDKDLPHLLPSGYELQRTPVTNLQFEALDANHRRWRQMQWFRPEMESEDRALDNHPVVEVTAYQGDILTIWMTGHGAFGTFRLPFEEDWEAGSRSGRDSASDEFGIPWCDEQRQPILDENGNEQFGSLSSHGANFNGNFPFGIAEKGPYLNGTVPVNRYPANGFGIVDMHGQVWEWMDNDHNGEVRASELKIGARRGRCVRGGSWYNGGRRVSSDRGINDIRDNDTGFRVSRTK